MKWPKNKSVLLWSISLHRYMTIGEQGKEQKEMEKKRVEKVMANGALKLVKQNVNSACVWWTYQPEFPKGIEKNKKF